MLLSNLDLLATAPGGVARLRELILTLAVQGKLVSQDPADEPASELLKKIRVEKDRLIAAGKIKRDKPVVEIADEEKPFELPQGWEWVRLNTLLQKIGAGSTPRGGREVYTQSGVKFLRSQNVWDDGLRLTGVAFIDPKTHARMAGTVVLPNDLLFNITGASIGRCAVVPSDFDEANVSQHVTIVRTVLPALNAFLHRVLVSRHVQQTVMDVQVGVSREGLSIAKLGHFLIPLPPLAEQSRIVTRVEELMRLCDALEAKGQLEATQHAQLVSTLLGQLTVSSTPDELHDNWQRVAQHFDLLLDRPAAVDALEQTILQLAVRGLLVPQDPTDEPASILLQKIRLEKDRLIAEGKIKRDKPLPRIAEDEKPFEVPEGWEWARLGDVATIASNLVQPALHRTAWQVAPDCIEKGTGRLLAKRTVAQAEVISANHLFKSGQILYSKIRPSLSKAVLVDFAGLCSADMYPIETPLDSQYLLQYILSQAFLDQVSIAENRVKMPKLNQEALTAFIVALPPLVEQSRIVTRVESLRRLCADLRQRLAARQTTQAHLAEALVKEVA